MNLIKVNFMTKYMKLVLELQESSKQLKKINDVFIK